ncbi:MAG: NYN domain-containing protein [Spirochaetota bacterium]
MKNYPFRVFSEGTPEYIIDGYNVILNRVYFPWKGSKKAGFDSFEDRRRDFLRLLDSYAVRKKVSITVVWDAREYTGQVRGNSRSLIRSIYTSPGVSADERIIQMVERSKKVRRITVVSDDRRHIKEIVKNLGAKAMGVKDFLSLIGVYDVVSRMGIGRDHKRIDEKEAADKSIADDLSIDEWLKLFNSDS